MVKYAINIAMSVRFNELGNKWLSVKNGGGKRKTKAESKSEEELRVSKDVDVEWK